MQRTILTLFATSTICALVGVIAAHAPTVLP